MKKLLLLLASGSIAFSAGAQQRVMSAVSTLRSEEGFTKVKKSDDMRAYIKSKNNAASKGTAPNRWYYYADYFDTLMEIQGFGTDLTVPLLWNDTLARFQTTTGESNNTMVSVANVFDPSFPGFNNYDYYPGIMRVTPTDAVTITKVDVWGLYGYNTSKASVVDTIRLSFVRGSGGPIASDDIFSGYSLGAGGHYGSTCVFMDVHYDSVRNYLQKAGILPTLAGTPNTGYTYDILLNNSGATPAWGDTLANGLWHKEITLPTPMNVPANGYAAASISFKSGDASFPTTTPGTLVFNSDGTYNYNMFRPLIMYKTDGTTTDPQWVDYTHPITDSNANLSYYRRLPAYLNGWEDTYVPLWAWSTNSGANAATLQHIYMGYEVQCAACGVTFEPVVGVNQVATVTKANAYPNPAADQVNVPFTVSAATEVTVTLSNVLGQVVATQNMGKVSTGTAVFNTATFAPGVYTYSVNTNGQKTTGRVVLAH